MIADYLIGIAQLGVLIAVYKELKGLAVKVAVHEEKINNLEGVLKNGKFQKTIIGT